MGVLKEYIGAPNPDTSNTPPAINTKRLDELRKAKLNYIKGVNNPTVNTVGPYKPIDFNDPNANPNVNLSVNPVNTPPTEPPKPVSANLWATVSGDAGGNPSINPNTTVAAPATPIDTTTPTGTGDPIQDSINQLGEAQKASKIAGLEKAKTEALGSLDEREGKIKPEFYEKRRQANVASDNNKRQFAEYLASKGLSSSGLAGQGELNRMSDLSSSIGSFNKQELGAVSDIARDRSTIETNFAFDKTNAEAGVDSQTLASSIDHMERGADREITEAGLTGTYKGEQTVEGMMAMAGLTGTYTDADGNTHMTQDARNNYIANFGYDPVSGEYTMAYDSTQFNEAMARTESFGKVSAEDAKTLGVKAGTSTLEAKSILYDQAYNIFQSTGVAKGAIAKTLGLKEGTTTLEGNNQIFNQAMGRWQTTGKISKSDAKILGLPEGTLTSQERTQVAEIKMNQINAAMARTEMLGYVSSADAKILGVKAGTKTEQARQAAANQNIQWANVANDKASIAVSQQNANTNSAQLAWDKDPTNPKNIKADTSTNNTVDDYSKTIDTLYVTKFNASTFTQASVNKDGIKAYLDSLIKSGVSDDIIDQLVARYGIK